MRTMLYHRTEKPRIVATEDEVRALLDAGWADTPAAFYDTPEPKPEPPRRRVKTEPT